MYIGDPTIIAWVIVAAYVFAAVGCIFKAIESSKFGRNAQFWIFLAIFLLFLGINKQLDLQTWFEHSMKAAAKAHGWYQEKAVMQQLFIAALGLGIMLFLISFRLLLVNIWRNYVLTCLGIILLGVFIFIRAAAFNHLDILNRYQIFGIYLNELLELSAILLIIIGTFLNKKHIHPLASSVSMGDYVEIKKEGDIVRCPQCGTQPLSKTRDDRLFKCRSCGLKYTVRVVDH